jgi:hypothetical protein
MNQYRALVWDRASALQGFSSFAVGKHLPGVCKWGALC